MTRSKKNHLKSLAGSVRAATGVGNVGHFVVDKRDEARALRNINTLVRRVRRHARETAKQAGEEYVKLVKSGIGQTTTPQFVPSMWKPLSASWKAQKTAQKELFWIETGGIYQAVRVDVLLNTMLYIHIFAGIQKKTDSQAFERVLRNEFGAGWGPARPLFGPARDVFSVPVGAGKRKLKPGSAQLLNFQAVVSQAVRAVYGGRSGGGSVPF